MNRTPRFQKLALLAHIAFSVGWFGAVVPYVALAIAALTSRDEQMARAAGLSMNLIGWYVIGPFSLAALLSGLVQSLGTKWGLFRHWWVLVKFALTLVAVAILFEHMRDVSRVFLKAGPTAFSDSQLHAELVHSIGGMLTLFAIMMLSVLKPWGMTAHGRRRTSPTEIPIRPHASVSVHEPIFASAKPRWGRIIGFHAIGISVVLAIVHLAILHHH